MGPPGVGLVEIYNLQQSVVQDSAFQRKRDPGSEIVAVKLT